MEVPFFDEEERQDKTYQGGNNESEDSLIDMTQAEEKICPYQKRYFSYVLFFPLAEQIGAEIGLLNVARGDAGQKNQGEERVIVKLPLLSGQFRDESRRKEGGVEKINGN